MSNESNQNQADTRDLLQIRRDKLQELREQGHDPYQVTRYPVTHYSTDIKENIATLEGQRVSIAGRLMSKRVMGKASFAHLQDNNGRIQAYVRRDELGDEAYAFFKRHCDIGDIIGVEGEVFITQKGEISVKAYKVSLLSKSLQILPEKFHGLTDKEIKYRQRYVDLIMNPDVKDTFVKRSQIIRELRRFMDDHGFVEVDTPILTPFEIGASARPFNTHLNALNMDMVLRIETELYLKRLIVGGFDKVYEVGRIFRNEGMDLTHNPEFTSIEFYWAYADFHDLMDFTEEMMRTVAQNVCGTTVVPFMDYEIDLGHWERLSMKEAVKKYSGVDFDDWKTDEDAIEAAKKYEVPLPEVPSRGAILAEFFDAFVEDHLIQPTFIYDYPVEISPLAKRKPDDPEFTERYEYFICGTEFGNAFSELNDPIDQRERFERQVAERKALDSTCKAQVDYDFINALEYGMPPTAGQGFGVDRLIMLLTGNSSIRDVLLFPMMKPLDNEKNMRSEEETATEPAAAPAETEPVDFSKVQIEPLFEEFVDFETFSKSDFRAVKVLECEAVPKSKKLLKFTLDDGTDTPRVILSGIHDFYEPETLVGKTCIAITNLPPRKMMGIDSCGMLISAVHKEESDASDGGVEEKLHLLMVDPHIPAGAKLY